MINLHRIRLVNIKLTYKNYVDHKFLPRNVCFLNFWLKDSVYLIDCYMGNENYRRHWPNLNAIISDVSSQ